MTVQHEYLKVVNNDLFRPRINLGPGCFKILMHTKVGEPISNHMWYGIVEFNVPLDTV